MNLRSPESYMASDDVSRHSILNMVFCGSSFTRRETITNQPTSLRDFLLHVMLPNSTPWWVEAVCSTRVFVLHSNNAAFSIIASLKDSLAPGALSPTDYRVTRITHPPQNKGHTYHHRPNGSVQSQPVPYYSCFAMLEVADQSPQETSSFIIRSWWRRGNTLRQPMQRISAK